MIVGMEMVRSGEYLILESRPWLHAPIGKGLVAVETATPIYSFPTRIIRQRHAKMPRNLQVFRSILLETFRKMTAGL